MPDLPVWTELERSVAASMPLIGEVRDLGRAVFETLGEIDSNPWGFNTPSYAHSAAWAREAHAALQVAKIVLQKLVDEAPIREGERQA